MRTDDEQRLEQIVGAARCVDRGRLERQLPLETGQQHVRRFVDLQSGLDEMRDHLDVGIARIGPSGVARHRDAAGAGTGGVSSASAAVSFG